MKIEECKVGMRVACLSITGTITGIGKTCLLVQWDLDNGCESIAAPSALSSVEPKPWAPPEPLEVVEQKVDALCGINEWRSKWSPVVSTWQHSWKQQEEGITWRRTGRRVVTEEIKR